MRFAAGILGILGALAGGALGWKWKGDLDSDMGKQAQALAGAVEGGMEIKALERATYALLACALLGLVVSVLIMARKGQRFVNAIVLVVAGVLPVVFHTNALFGAPMVLAGLLALAVKYDDAPKPPPA
jgi:hypothetical protein